MTHGIKVLTMNNADDCIRVQFDSSSCWHLEAVKRTLDGTPISHCACGGLIAANSWRVGVKG